MKINRFYLLICSVSFSFLFLFQTAYSQGNRKLRINEFLVHNENNYVDDYGEHVAWIEIFNEAYNPINISMLYITNDIDNPKKYRIPNIGGKGIIHPREFVVFFADNKTERGPFHLNFELEESGYIAIFDSDAKTLMDSVHYKSQYVDKTYGRETDGDGAWGYLDKSTPNTSNVLNIKETGAEEFQRLDKHGIVLTIIAMIVVFSGLILLFFIYKWMGIINQKQFSYKIPKKHTHPTIGEEIIEEKHIMSGELNAAIATAIYLYADEMHDVENTIITIKKVVRPYSPWSSKIYGIRKYS